MADWSPEMGLNMNTSVSSNVIKNLPRAQKYMPKVTGAPYKRTDVIENAMIRHCDKLKRKPVSINFFRVILKQLTVQIDAELEPYAKMRLVSRKNNVYQAIKGFQFCYASGDKQAESARKFCRLHGIVLPDELEVTRKAIDGSIFSQIGESRGSISVTHNLKGSDFNGARFAPNSGIVGNVPLKRDAKGEVSDSVIRSKTVKLFDEKLGKMVKTEIELADVPKIVSWSQDTKFSSGRNTFMDRSTGKTALIPNPKRDKTALDKPYRQ